MTLLQRGEASRLGCAQIIVKFQLAEFPELCGSKRSARLRLKALEYRSIPECSSRDFCLDVGCLV